MSEYSRKGFKPLTKGDWEKVHSLHFSGRWPDSLQHFLKRLEAKEICPDEDSSEGGWCVSDGSLARLINSTFRKAGLPYRVFSASFGGQAYRIGIVEPFKRDGRPRKIKLTSNGRQVVIYVLARAHAVVKNPSRKNVAALGRAIRHPRLPTSYLFDK